MNSAPSSGRGYRVVRFDNRDIGQSTRFDRAGVPDVQAAFMAAMQGRPVEAPYLLSDMADDVVGLMDALDIAAAHVVGASMGGAIGQTMVLARFLRLVTSPKIFQQPTTIEEAIGFVDALLSLPGAQLAELGPEWARFQKLCLDKKLSGDDLPDAWLAAAVAQRGEHLVSFDRDSRKLIGRGQLTLLAAATP